jgi:hypothetical protein
VAAAGNRIRLDLNSPEFQDVFFRLEIDNLTQVVASLRRLRELDWNSLYRHTSFRGEVIEHLKAPNGAKVYSRPISQRIRAVAFRDGDFLRLVSLHLTTIRHTNVKRDAVAAIQNGRRASVSTALFAAIAEQLCAEVLSSAEEAIASSSSIVRGRVGASRPVIADANAAGCRPTIKVTADNRL